jgi:hypothetical protein
MSQAVPCLPYDSAKHLLPAESGWSQAPASRQAAGVTERQPETSCPVPVPPGSTLSGTTSVSEIRAFPRIAVRDTHPPTVEIVEVARAAAESR